MSEVWDETEDDEEVEECSTIVDDADVSDEEEEGSTPDPVATIRIS